MLCRLCVHKWRPCAVSAWRGVPRRKIFWSREASVTADSSVLQRSKQAAKEAEIKDRLRTFEWTLDHPQRTLVTRKRARGRYLLSREHIRALSPVLKENPYDPLGDKFHNYWMGDVVTLALQINTKEKLLSHYKEYLQQGKDDVERVSAVYALPSGDTAKARFRAAPFLQQLTRVSAFEGSKSVSHALGANTVLLCIKGCVWLLTGSMAMFADVMHSVVDVTNTVLRLIGIGAAANPANATRPYGNERAGTLWAYSCAGVLLLMGGLLPLACAAHTIWLHEPYEMQCLPALVVFTACTVFESFPLRQSFSELSAKARLEGSTFSSHVFGGRANLYDLSVLVEGVLGVAGGMIGMVGVFCVWYTTNPMYDAAAAACMAGTVVCGSVVLLRKFTRGLLDDTLPLARLHAVNRVLETDLSVTSLHDVKTSVYGTKTVRYKAEVNLNAEAIARKHWGVPLNGDSDIPASWRSEMKAIESTDQTVEWVMGHTVAYQQALSTELRRLERKIREELKEYKSVHVDLKLV